MAILFPSICALLCTVPPHATLIVHIGVQIFGSGSFGKGTGPVLFISLSCGGTEYSPADCTQTGASYSSSHNNDIGVRCLQKGLQFCIKMLRLSRNLCIFRDCCMVVVIHRLVPPSSCKGILILANSWSVPIRPFNFVYSCDIMHSWRTSADEWVQIRWGKSWNVCQQRVGKCVWQWLGSTRGSSSV